MKKEKVIKENKIYYGINLKFSNTNIASYVFENIYKTKELKKLYYTSNYICSKKELNVSSQKDDKYLNICIKQSENGVLYVCNDKIFDSLESIINIYFVVPQLFLSNFNECDYKRKLVVLEEKKYDEKHKIFKNYDDIFKRNFNVKNGMIDVFEWFTGSVYFKDFEWESLTDNHLKDLFMTKEKQSYIYSLPTDNGIMLRGANIYYYFSSDVSRFEKPNKEHIIKWYHNCTTFITDAINILKNYNIKNTNDLKLLLAVVDNMRNIILLLCNAEIMSINPGSNFLYNTSCLKNELAFNKYELLIKDYQNLIKNLCFIRPVENIVVDNVIKLLEDTLNVSKITIDKVCKIKDSFILGKAFNPLREIDNYFENYIVCEETIKKIMSQTKPSVKQINLIGILYGGLELPFIIKNNNFTDVKINISYIFQNHGMYLDRQIKDKSKSNNDLLIIDKKENFDLTFLVDDNVMSGVTMQLIYNQLLTLGYKIDGALLIRHPNINRLAQLFHFKTAVNIDLIDKWFHGLVTDTPYSKIKDNTNYNNMFVNELNIFSIMTEVFLKALYINNSFIKDSQVDIFQGYSEGRNDKI